MNIDIVNVLSAIGSIISIIFVAYFVYRFFLKGHFSFVQIVGFIFSIIIFVSCTLVWTNTLGTELRTKLGCTDSLSEAKKKEESTECNHQWIEIETSSDGAIHTIYCPACESEKEVDSKEWNKIQADIEYQKYLEE